MTLRSRLSRQGEGQLTRGEFGKGGAGRAERDLRCFFPLSEGESSISFFFLPSISSPPTPLFLRSRRKDKDGVPRPVVALQLGAALAEAPGTARRRERYERKRGGESREFFFPMHSIDRFLLSSRSRSSLSLLLQPKKKNSLFFPDKKKLSLSPSSPSI